MTPAQGADRGRVLRRRHRRERQAVLFSVLAIALAAVTLGSLAVYTGAVRSPLARDFTTAAPDAGRANPPPPCPPVGTLPVAYQNIQLTVLNATHRAGLATETSNALAGRGFIILSTGNAQSTVSGVARIGFGRSGVGAAYTLAAQLDHATLVLDNRSDGTLDLTVGSDYVALVDPSTITLDPSVPLTGAPSCVPLADAVVTPAAAATVPPPAASS